MVTARGALSDRLIGYESGADAYLGKPIVLDELDAVVAAVARRVRPSMVAEFLLDTAAERLTGPEGSVALAASQVAMLDALAVAPERSLRTAELVQALVHAPETYRKASLEVHVARLRERLAQVGVGAERGGIVAVRGTGYRLTIDLQVRRIAR